MRRGREGSQTVAIHRRASWRAANPFRARPRRARAAARNSRSRRRGGRTSTGCADPPVHWIEAHEIEDVVHPPHVPLEPETEPAEVRWTRDHGPRGRLLRGDDPAWQG